MDTNSEKSLQEKLNEISSAVGPFAPIPNESSSSKAKAMKSSLDEIDHSVGKDTTSAVEYALAIGFRNFTAWYIRGDERKTYLEKAAAHLKKAIALDPDNKQAKTELASLLIEEKQIRDLDEGLGLAQELQEEGLLPSWMDSIVQKAKRWKGRIEIPIDNDFSKLDVTPAVLGEERTRLRKILVASLKEKNSHNARIVAIRLYNLALLVAILYGGHDCDSAVSGAMYDSAEKKHKDIGSSLNYEYMGRIQDANFLSDTDYTRLEKVLGEQKATLSISQIQKLFAAR